MLCTSAAVTDMADATKEHTDDLAAFEKAAEPGTTITGADITEPRSRIYLELAEDLAADAEPDVVVVGGAVYDLAGNTNDAKTVEAADWIAPSLTVTVTGTANDRPVVNKDGSFTVDVRSDEDLNRRPVVYFVSITADIQDADDVKDKYTYTIGGGRGFPADAGGGREPLVQEVQEVQHRGRWSRPDRCHRAR